MHLRAQASCTVGYGGWKDPHQSTLLQRFRSLGTKGSACLQRHERTWSDALKILEENYFQTGFDTQTNSFSKERRGEDIYRHTRSQTIEPPSSLSQEAPGAGALMQEGGWQGTQTVEERKRPETRGSGHLTWKEGKGIPRLTKTRNPQISVESQAEAGDSLNSCGHAQPRAPSAQAPFLPNTQAGTSFYKEAGVWPTQSELATGYVPNKNGHTEAGPLGESLLTSDPVGHHTEENAN